MTTAQLVTMFFDIGFGLSALRLASRLTTRVVAQEKRGDDHEVRIAALEKA